MNSESIVALKAFLPSKDYKLSIKFYTDIGFTANLSNQEVTEFKIGDFRFLLTPYYVKEFAENSMMQLTVKNVDDWWRRLNQLEITKRYPGITFKEPAVQPWGLKVLYLSDPAGVLWHIGE